MAQDQNLKVNLEFFLTLTTSMSKSFCLTFLTTSQIWPILNMSIITIGSSYFAWTAAVVCHFVPLPPLLTFYGPTSTKLWVNYRNHKSYHVTQLPYISAYLITTCLMLLKSFLCLPIILKSLQPTGFSMIYTIWSLPASLMSFPLSLSLGYCMSATLVFF